MEEWEAELAQGRPEVAWELVLARYRRLIFAAIRRYAQDHDDVMDVFAHVCEALRENDLRRLKAYTGKKEHQARFSTWLVTVVHHLTVDWFRHRDGRRRLPALAKDLPPVQRAIFECVFVDGRSHLESFELIRSRNAPDLSFREFQAELRATYRAVNDVRPDLIRGEIAVPPPPEYEPDPLAMDDARATTERVGEVMASLAPDDRLAVQLYVIDDLPAGDVARILGLPNVKAVYNKVYRSLAVLRERLERTGIGPEDMR